MCGDDDAPDYDPALADAMGAGEEHGDGLLPPNRRGFLLGAGAAVAATGLVLPGGRALAAEATAPRQRNALAPGGDASPPMRAAMHVHTNDEGQGDHSASAGVQFKNADGVDTDLLVLTPHSHRQRATYYITTLDDTKLAPVTTGDGGTTSASRSGPQQGTLHLVAQAGGSGPVSAGYHPETGQAKNRLRTTLAGHTVTLTFGQLQLDRGASFEMRVPLSTHAAYRTLKAGAYTLVHRFTDDGSPGRSLEDNGFTGVVTHPVPAPGAVVVIDMVGSLQPFWPDMHGDDNCFFDLVLTARSAQAGARADVTLAQLRIQRSRSNPAELVKTFTDFIDTYGPRHPGMTTWASAEVSGFDNPHINYFGVPQRFPDEVHGAGLAAAYDAFVDQVHDEGGAVSLNHPFGPTGGPPLSPAAATSRLHEVAAELIKNGRYGTDVLEVAYYVRGYVTIDTHLALWDVLSQHGIFVTGNGANDDHSGRNWKPLGFLTGMWCPDLSPQAVVKALVGGRAYATHPAYWPLGHLDLQVRAAGAGGADVPMGGVVVSGATKRTLDVTAVNLPAGATVELWGGGMDSGSLDPNTTVIRTFKAGDFGTSAICSTVVGTSTSRFFRAVVRNSGGRIIGVGNPVWVLKQAPAGGIPAARRY